MSNTITHPKIQMFGAWSGIYYSVLLLIGWWLVADFVPAHLPSAGKEEIAAIFQQDTMKIRIGMVICMFAAMFMIPFGAAVSTQIARIEGKAGVLTYSCVMGCFGNAMLSFYPPIWWLIAAYRPERSAEIIYIFNDVAWLQFIGGLTVFLPILGSMAIAALIDKSEDRVFPRWSGYLCIWIFVLTLPGQLLFFFKTGPFAWNGLIAFWVPVTVFFVWFVVTFYLLRSYILRQTQVS